MAHRHAYTRGPVDLATVFIAAGWIGLWFLWPPLDRWTVRPNQMPAPRVFLAPATRSDVAVPLPLVRPPPVAVTSRLDNVAWPLGRLLSQPERIPRYLDRGSDSVMIAPGASPALAVDLGSYRPAWRDGKVFPAGPAPMEMRLLAEVSGALRKRNFEAPPLLAEEAKRFDKPWQVTVYVEVNEAGAPTHVILDAGCDDAKINSAVVKALHRGKASKPGPACGGRVVVSYGLP